MKLTTSVASDLGRGPAHGPVVALPGGGQWLNELAERTDDERHVDHCVPMNDAADAASDAGGSAIVEQTTITGSPAEMRSRIDELGERGVTEVVYRSARPDTRRELAPMIGALR